MKRKTLFKRLSSAAMALLLSLSALTQGITASAFSSTNKATQEWLNEWSYDFRGSGLPTAMTLKRASPMTHTSQATGQAQCRISQHLTAAMLIVSTLISCTQTEQPLNSKH